MPDEKNLDVNADPDQGPSRNGPEREPSELQQSNDDEAAAVERQRQANREAIAEAAYRRAQQRGFAPGGELEDWLAAEREIEERKGAGSLG